MANQSIATQARRAIKGCDRGSLMHIVGSYMDEYAAMSHETREKELSERTATVETLTAQLQDAREARKVADTAVREARELIGAIREAVSYRQDQKDITAKQACALLGMLKPDGTPNVNAWGVMRKRLKDSAAQAPIDKAERAAKRAEDSAKREADAIAKLTYTEMADQLILAMRGEWNDDLTTAITSLASALADIHNRNMVAA